jgi:hypothetical protein
VAAQIPNEWPVDLKDQLLQRDVISRVGKEDVFRIRLEPQQAETRIKEMPVKEPLLQALQKARCDAPVITLTNPSAAHWSNMQSVDEPKLAPQSAAVKLELEVAHKLSARLFETVSTKEKWADFANRLIQEDQKTALAKEIKYTVVEETHETRVQEEIVSRDAQMKLDQELAKRWQYEEDSLFKQTSKMLEDDQALARRLQEEENQRFSNSKYK